jgi:hypothetical protein
VPLGESPVFCVCAANATLLILKLTLPILVINKGEEIRVTLSMISDDDDNDAIDERAAMPTKGRMWVTDNIVCE